MLKMTKKHPETTVQSYCHNPLWGAGKRGDEELLQITLYFIKHLERWRHRMTIETGHRGGETQGLSTKTKRGIN